LPQNFLTGLSSFFLGSIFVLFYFRNQLRYVLSRGGVTLVWAENSFSISELPEQLNESFAPVTDDIEELRQRLESLEKRFSVSAPDTPPPEDAAVRAIMLKALAEGKYTWRSIERLASISGISTKKASEILRPLDVVAFSRGKSGRSIVKLV
jgi:hypothetical protein